MKQSGRLRSMLDVQCSMFDVRSVVRRLPHRVDLLVVDVHGVGGGARRGRPRARLARHRLHVAIREAHRDLDGVLLSVPPISLIRHRPIGQYHHIGDNELSGRILDILSTVAFDDPDAVPGALHADCNFARRSRITISSISVKDLLGMVYRPFY